MQQIKIGIIGTGYVGLVTAIGLAELGHEIKCIDIDQTKIDLLNNQQIPIYEPGLAELLNKNQSRIIFSTTYDELIDTQVIFIAVGTPTDLNTGEANLSYLYNVIESLKKLPANQNQPRLVIIKSTVPVGTNDQLTKLVANDNLEFASNPEFLREGCAIEDFFNPARIVIGIRSHQAENILNNIYQKLIDKKIPMLAMDPTSAELAKYTANSFLAMKISFANEIARICDTVGADSKLVLDSIKYDTRIGKLFLDPSPGYGGSCFPKDCLALTQLVHKQNISAPIISNINNSNQLQKEYIIQTIEKLAEINDNILILGLTFKANTDDIRDSASLFVIEQLLKKNYNLSLYDPMYKNTIDQQKININVKWLSNLENIKNYQTILILTEWEEFIKIKSCDDMSQVNIIDFRNMFEIEEMINLKLKYHAVGRLATYEHKKTLV